MWNAIQWPCRATTWHLRNKRRKSSGKKPRKGKCTRRDTNDAPRSKGRNRKFCRWAFPVHQRFYFLFIHNGVVDCDLLLHGSLPHFIVIFVKRVRARRCSFWYSQTDNMGHSERLLLTSMHTESHLGFKKKKLCITGSRRSSTHSIF